MNATRNGYRTLFAFLALAGAAMAAEVGPPTGGELRIIDDAGTQVGACPLKHTDVEADVAGFVGRTLVRQTFHNPLDRKIEAVYVFPLPQDAAVDHMVMTVGDRRIVGQIKQRDEARQIYEAARQAGHVAGLLDQARPNIFTQSVANIEPGVEVVIEIGYVETLKYEDGLFEYVFPMVVGPRYIPGGGSAPAPMTTGTPTPEVPDAHRITPPVTPEGTRAGHDIGITVRIDAGTELFDLTSVLHDVEVSEQGAGRATVKLVDQATIPNKDFILRYRTATDEIGDAVLLHQDGRGTFFTLVLQPPRRVLPGEAMPKEMIFVIDRSGSMSGFPIEKAKETMRLCIEMMNPRDTFNLLSFSGGTGRCFEKPVANTAENRTTALKYLADLYGSGGTEMMKAIKAALEGQDDPERVRIVCFMTDGYIGNDFAIVDAVRRNAGTARVFAFGIGNSVNRFLLDGMAHAGRGEVEYVTLASQGEQAAKRFAQRINAPVLTDIEIDWGELSISEVYPALLPDLFSVKPIMIHGRLGESKSGTIVLRGQTGGGPFERQIRLELPAAPPQHPAVASLWARAKVSHLMHQDMAALQRGNFPEDLKGQVTQLGLDYNLMTQFTSFVAVEEMTVTVGGEPVRVDVPVEMPDGVSYEGIFGCKEESGLRGGVAGRMILGRSMRRYGGVAGSEVKAARLAPRAAMPLERMNSLRVDVDRVGDAPQKPSPQAKLAQSLQGLAERVTKQGTDGSLSLGKLRVIDYRVDVIVYLRDLSADTLAALTKLGFMQKADSKAVRLVIGSIDVRKLQELAKLDAVLRITPVEGT